MKPLARRDGLVVRDLDDETLVYDRERHQAHCLNRTSAAVFRLCDGARSAERDRGAAGRARRSGARGKRSSRPRSGSSPTARLLVERRAPRSRPSRPLRPRPSTSRRELLRLAALAVPVIASIVAPTPAQAASACVPETQCGQSENYCEPCDIDCGSDVCSLDIPANCVPSHL